LATPQGSFQRYSIISWVISQIGGWSGVAQQKPGEHEGCPLASFIPLHLGACGQLLRKPQS